MMKEKNEISSTAISDLNVESNDNAIRVIDKHELELVAGGWLWFTSSSDTQEATSVALFGSTYTQTQISGQ